MPEPIDVYSDQFQINMGPYGATLNFLLSGATPPSPGSAPQVDKLATIRMSLEHLKVMIFVLRRQILEYERASGVQLQLPSDVLNALGIGREDWDALWR